MNRKELLILIACKFTWLLILFFGKSGRVAVRNKRHWNALCRQRKNFIILSWHGKMLLPIFAHRNLGICAMVSEHDDGEMIAQTIHRLGYTTVRGSSTRGGSKAFRQMLTRLKKGVIGAILPDGPNGPRFEVKMGAILLAQRSDAWLLPVTFSTNKPIVLKSWDRFTFWRPFAKLCMAYGEPIRIPRNLGMQELEIHRKRVEDEMNALQREADAVFRK